MIRASGQNSLIRRAPLPRRDTRRMIHQHKLRWWPRGKIQVLLEIRERPILKVLASEVKAVQVAGIVPAVLHTPARTTSNSALGRGENLRFRRLSASLWRTPVKGGTVPAVHDPKGPRGGISVRVDCELSLACTCRTDSSIAVRAKVPAEMCKVSQNCTVTSRILANRNLDVRRGGMRRPLTVGNGEGSDEGSVNGWRGVHR
jgi:hypothetical protein